MEWQAHGKALEGAGVSANRWVEPQFKENRASTRLLDI
jgi:hypothetical protein